MLMYMIHSPSSSSTIIVCCIAPITTQYIYELSGDDAIGLLRWMQLVIPQETIWRRIPNAIATTDIAVINVPRSIRRSGTIQVGSRIRVDVSQL